MPSSPLPRLHDSPAAPQDRDVLAPGVEPLLVPAPQAARLSGVSEATWWRLHAAAKVPRPVKLGGRTLWRAEELREWVRAGIPDHRTWEALQASERGCRR